MTRVPELLAAGVNVAFGHDCVMDPWYGMGSADMLDVAHMGLHVVQMTSQTGIKACYEAVTVNAAKVMHLPGYGIEAGCDASFVLLQARDVVEAIRLKAYRSKVWNKGQALADAPELRIRLMHVGRTTEACDFRRVCAHARFRTDCTHDYHCHRAKRSAHTEPLLHPTI